MGRNQAEAGNTTIGIAGASGQLGRLIVENLKGKVPAADIVALVRTPARVADLGVSARGADYGKTETLDRAFAGLGTLLLISSSELGERRAAQHHNVIEAAKRVGVRRIVYTSLLHADTSPLILADEHRGTEAEIKASGIPFTMLRNGWYTENYTASVPAGLAGGAFLGSAGNGRISSAFRIDYAEAAVAVLSSDGHDGKSYELAGDEAYSLSDLAAEISRQTGKTIPYKNLSEAEYAAALTGIGVPEALARAYARYDVGASLGALFDDSRQLSRLIGRPTGTLATAVADALQRASPER